MDEDVPRRQGRILKRHRDARVAERREGERQRVRNDGGARAENSISDVGGAELGDYKLSARTAAATQYM